MLNRTMLAVELPFSIDLPRLRLHQGETRVDARMIVLETDASGMSRLAMPAMVHLTPLLGPSGLPVCDILRDGAKIKRNRL
jgi:hypothetical protein